MARRQALELEEVRVSGEEGGSPLGHGGGRGRGEAAPSSWRSCILITTLVLAVISFIVALVALGDAEYTSYRVRTGLLSPAGQYQALLSLSPVAPEGFKLAGAAADGTGQWVRKPWLPVGRAEFAAAEVETAAERSVIVLAGGESNGTTTASVALFDVLRETYTSGASLPAAVRSHGAAAVARRLVVTAGGYTAGGAASAAVYVYDAVSGTWKVGSSLATARGELAVVQAQGTVYALGGAATGGATAATGTLVEALAIGTDDDDVAAFFANPTAKTWTAKASLLVARSDFSAASDPTGAFIFVAGGRNDGDSDGGLLANVEVYEIAKNKWTAITPLPQALSDAGVVLYKSSLLVFGGQAWAGGEAYPVHTVSALALEDFANAFKDSARRAGLIWTQRAALPANRVDFAAAVSETTNVTYVFGGHTLSDDVPDDDVTAFYDSYHVPMYVHVLASQIQDLIPWNNQNQNSNNES
jgi:hypothetical protein